MPQLSDCEAGIHYVEALVTHGRRRRLQRKDQKLRRGKGHISDQIEVTTGPDEAGQQRACRECQCS